MQKVCNSLAHICARGVPNRLEISVSVIFIRVNVVLNY